MYRNFIKIGIARKSVIERYPAHLVKVSGRALYAIWEMTGSRECLVGGTLEEVTAWAKENGYKLDATNRLGKGILNA